MRRVSVSINARKVVDCELVSTVSRLEPVNRANRIATRNGDVFLGPNQTYLRTSNDKNTRTYESRFERACKSAGFCLARSRRDLTSAFQLVFDPYFQAGLVGVKPSG